MGSGRMAKRKARPYKRTGIKAKPGTKAYSDEYYDRFRMKKPGRKRHGGGRK